MAHRLIEIHSETIHEPGLLWSEMDSKGNFRSMPRRKGGRAKGEGQMAKCTAHNAQRKTQTAQRKQQPNPHLTRIPTSTSEISKEHEWVVGDANTQYTLCRATGSRTAPPVKMDDRNGLHALAHDIPYTELRIGGSKPKHGEQRGKQTH